MRTKAELQEEVARINKVLSKSSSPYLQKDLRKRSKKIKQELRKVEQK